jgi:TPR repeat protein
MAAMSLVDAKMPQVCSLVGGVAMRRALLALAVSVVMAGGALAGPLEDAIAVARSGDYATAVGLLRPLAEQGDTTAQMALAAIYRLGGHGVTVDYAESERWYRRAGEGGVLEAQAELGNMYEFGVRVPRRDLAESVRWYRLAAEHGTRENEVILADYYMAGNGVAQDYEEAARWYRRAAEHGHFRAQNTLAEFYENGRGVPQDLVQAHFWYALAARTARFDNRDLGIRGRDRVAARMTPTQIAEAQRLAREWDAAHPQPAR